MQPTALVHEAFMRLVDQSRVDWNGRTHFYAVGAEAMRRILIDHARAKGRVKRGGEWQRVDLDQADTPEDLRDIDLQKVGLEIEGYWDQAGKFVATEVEVVPGLRRPKLRGPIQRVDVTKGTFTVFGVPIHVLESTELVGSAAEGALLDGVRPGQRVEGGDP